MPTLIGQAIQQQVSLLMLLTASRVAKEDIPPQGVLQQSVLYSFPRSACHRYVKRALDEGRKVALDVGRTSKAVPDVSRHVTPNAINMVSIRERRQKECHFSLAMPACGLTADW